MRRGEEQSGEWREEIAPFVMGQQRDGLYREGWPEDGVEQVPEDVLARILDGERSISFNYHDATVSPHLHPPGTRGTVCPRPQSLTAHDTRSCFAELVHRPSADWRLPLMLEN